MAVVAMATAAVGGGNEGLAAETRQRPFQLTLMVDNVKNRVVYAECDRLMADVFFSFLTTPVGALVRRTGKSSHMGCMDTLYKIVEDMPAHCFETPECQKMLLRPRNAHGFAYHRLKLSVNDVDESFYVCPTGICPYIALFPGAKCECGRDLNTPRVLHLPPERGLYDEVFIDRDAPPFLVTDDLFIVRSTADLKTTLCTHAGVKSQGDLEQMIVFVDDQLIVQLMKLSLLSYNPLSGTFLSAELAIKPLREPPKPSPYIPIPLGEELFCWSLIWLAKRLIRLITSLFGPKKMAVTLFHDQDRVLYARVDKSFVDLLLSFLTLPFGSIAAAFDGNSFLRCIDNLHQSVERINSDGLFHKLLGNPDEWRECLLNPPIALHHTSCNQLFKIGKTPFDIHLIKCKSCEIVGLRYTCSDKGHTNLKREALNPKIKGNQVTEKSGGFMLAQETFVITNALVVKPNYDISKDIEGAGLVEKNVFLGRKEVLKLLKASLVSEDPLTRAFLPADRKHRKFWKKKNA